MSARQQRLSAPAWAGLIITGIVVPLLFPHYMTVFAFAWCMVVLALSWDICGGQMGYNSFGNIFFFGVGMYICAVVQRDLWHGVASGQAQLVLTAPQYLIGLGLGLVAGVVAAVALAWLLGSQILGMRGHYFAICTLGLGIAAGEIATGIDFIGAGSGMVTPLMPAGLPGKEVFYYAFFMLLALFALWLLSRLYAGRFGLALNAIRDNEDKAEAMGLPTVAYKTTAWAVSAALLALAGGGVGNLIGFIDPIDVAFAGASFGVWMILMAILGGKGTLWGPLIGAFLFYAAKEITWTYFLGWQRVMLGALIVVIVVFFPEGIMGWLRERFPARFGDTSETTTSEDRP